jgi:hypothetical protein
LLGCLSLVRGSMLHLGLLNPEALDLNPVVLENLNL